MLSTVAAWLTGNTGKGLATIAITILGIYALNGEVTRAVAFLCAIGVSIIFEADNLVDMMDAQADVACCTSQTGQDTDDS